LAIDDTGVDQAKNKVAKALSFDKDHDPNVPITQSIDNGVNFFILDKNDCNRPDGWW